MKFDTILTEMQYLAPIRYYAALLQYPAILIEQYEHFEKSSYRNRCYIAGPNGALRLTVPLKKGKNQHTVMKEVEIAYDFKWQKIHWQSVCSVYRTSPYFEYYEDRFAPFYEKNFKFLFDFNRGLMQTVLEALELDLNIHYTEKYQKNYPANVLDFRSAIHPKSDKAKPDETFSPPTYQQVFEDKTGFLPDMSMVDLLFCEGTHALDCLKSSIKK